MRGYGESDKPRRISDYQIDKLVEDVKELVLFLGREKFILVGHDWGAIGELFSLLLIPYLPHSFQHQQRTLIWLLKSFSWLEIRRKVHVSDRQICDDKWSST